MILLLDLLLSMGLERLYFASGRKRQNCFRSEWMA